MSKKKTSINQNFEALKAQMQAKRKLAESKFEEEKNNTKDVDNDEVITLNIVDDEINETETETLDIKIDNSDNIQEDEPTSIITTSKKKDAPDLNINKFIIKKVEKQEAPKRITYYLKPETIKKIDKFSKATGMGKSEFVQTILDEVLNNLEVEK